MIYIRNDRKVKGWQVVIFQSPRHLFGFEQGLVVGTPSCEDYPRLNTISVEKAHLNFAVDLCNGNINFLSSDT